MSYWKRIAFSEGPAKLLYHCLEGHVAVVDELDPGLAITPQGSAIRPPRDARCVRCGSTLSRRGDRTYHCGRCLDMYLHEDQARE